MGKKNWSAVYSGMIYLLCEKKHRTRRCKLPTGERWDLPVGLPVVTALEKSVALACLRDIHVIRVSSNTTC